MTPENENYDRRLYKILAVFAILLVGIGLTFVLASTKKETKKKEATQRVRQVATRPMVYDDHRLMIHGNGSIESQQSLQVVSLVGGEVIYSRGNLKSGQFVSKGDTLLRIDDREARNRTLQARSGLINAIVSLVPELRGNERSQAYDKWNRYLEQINMERTPALPAITDPQERIRVSMHNIFNQHATVKNAEINLERHTILAPFEGYLDSDGVLPGSWIAPGQPVVSIIDPFHLEIAVPLALSELELIPDNGASLAKVSPTEDPDRSLTGYLKRQNAHIDKRSQTVTIHVELSNPTLDPAFLPGNYMDVHIEGNLIEDVAVLPRDIIAPGPNLFTMEDSMLARYPVNIIATQGDSVLIARDLVPAGADVITTLIQSPIVGMRVAPFATDSTSLAATDSLPE